jgi:hypothetical protein
MIAFASAKVTVTPVQFMDDSESLPEHVIIVSADRAITPAMHRLCREELFILKSDVNLRKRPLRTHRCKGPIGCQFADGSSLSSDRF